MKKTTFLFAILLTSNTGLIAQESADNRQIIEMPQQTKQVFLSNMRGHMEALDQIIAALAKADLDEAAAIAETTMGVAGVGQGKKWQCDDSDGNHGHKHDQSEHKKNGFGKLMPAEMKAMGMNLHIAADNFANVARQGDRGEAYKALRQISASCVACHQSFGVK
jgi:cytochrome c'